MSDLAEQAPIRAEAVVVGGGPAGLVAAIALAQGGVLTALVAPREAYADNRTTALLAGSVESLEALGVWSRCRDAAAPIRMIRIIDDRGGLLRAPEVCFDAAEIGLEAFGHNVENHLLVAALEAAAADLPTLARIDGRAIEVEPGDEQVIVRTQSGADVIARIAVGADGRTSICRQAAGIGIEAHEYSQVAVTLTFTHKRPHSNISTEFHTDAGPFTLVPLPGDRSSLVWVARSLEAGAISRMTEAELNREVERRSHSILGKVTADPQRAVFPLTLQTAPALAAARIALIGEAAHVIPPIGAQGLNLGLRDAIAIAEHIISETRRGADPGSAESLAAYASGRQADMRSRTFAVDMLNRSLLTDFLPVQGARGLGLYLSSRIGPLRRALMRGGIGPRGASKSRGARPA